MLCSAARPARPSGDAGNRRFWGANPERVLQNARHEPFSGRRFAMKSPRVDQGSSVTLGSAAQPLTGFNARTFDVAWWRTATWHSEGVLLPWFQRDRFG